MKSIKQTAAFSIAALVFSGFAQAAVPASFAPAVNYATGGTGGPGPHTDAVAAGDFNGDGFPDLVVADYFSFSQGPRLMMNNGDGSFQSPGSVIPLQSFVGVAEAADLNGDGLDDLVATNASTVWALLSNGDGSFSQSWTASEWQGGQEGVEIADVNNDGNLDLGVQLEYGVDVFLGNGDGTFGDSVLTLLPDPTLSSFAFGDLNGDGNLDMAVTTAFTTQTVFTFLGNGDGSFDLASFGEAPLVPGDVMIGDVNSDGTPDVSVLAEFLPTQNIAVFISDGEGGFENPLTPGRYNGGYFTGNAGMADLNGDGIPDIAVPDVTTGMVTVIVGDGNGGFVSSGSYAAPVSPQGPAFADFNGDGKTDIAVAGNTSWFNPATLLAILRNTTP